MKSAYLLKYATTVSGKCDLYMLVYAHSFEEAERRLKSNVEYKDEKGNDVRVTSIENLTLSPYLGT